MICKLPDKRVDGGTSFRSLVMYMATGKRVDGTIDDDRVYYSGLRNMPELDLLEEYNVREVTLRDVYETMWFNSLNNKAVEDPVVHAILSFREGEIPTEDQCREAVTIWLKEQGLSECQTYWTVHANTDNYHIHLCVNRVDPLSHEPVHMEFWKKANERAARKIELQQGWELETSGHLAEVTRQKNGKVRVKDKSKKARSEDRAISGKARDYENCTGLKSGERIAKEIVAPILLSAKSWYEIHERLAEIGIELRQKGSGGILLIGDAEVKLSSASNKCSWSKMIKRLGDYQERDPKLKLREYEPQPLDIKGHKKTLEEYNKHKKAFFAAKKEAKKKLDAWIYEQRATFDKSKKQRRKKMYASQDWHGHGKELNEQRSLLARQFAIEHARLAAEIAERRKKYKELFARKWPSYEQWLRDQGLQEEAEIWRYRNAQAMILGASVVYAQIAVERYKPQVSGGLVQYKDQQGQTAFVDHGSRILVKQSDNEDAIRASIQVAAAKWGAIRLFGSNEFVARSIRIAAELGIRLRDPEQQRRADELRKELNIANTNATMVTASVDQSADAGDRATESREPTASDADRNAELAKLIALEQAVRSAAELAELERAAEESGRGAREAQQERFGAEKSRKDRDDRRADEARRRNDEKERADRSTADSGRNESGKGKGKGGRAD